MAYNELTAAPVVIVADHSSGGSVSLTGRTEFVAMVDGAANAFLRRYTINSSGAITAVANFQMDGTTAYTPVGTVWPFNPLVATRPNMVTSVHRYVLANSGVVLAAGALSVELLVVADAVSITTNGTTAALPVNTAVTIQQDGWGTPAITLTITGSGDVLVIENRIA